MTEKDPVHVRLECLSLAIDAQHPQPLIAAREWSDWVLHGEMPPTPSPVKLAVARPAIAHADDWKTS